MEHEDLSIVVPDLYSSRVESGAAEIDRGTGRQMEDGDQLGRARPLSAFAFKLDSQDVANQNLALSTQGSKGVNTDFC